MFQFCIEICGWHATRKLEKAVILILGTLVQENLEEITIKEKSLKVVIPEVRKQFLVLVD